MKMVFQYKRAQDQIDLDISNNPLPIFPTSEDPRDSLRKNIIKPKKNFNAFKKPIVAEEPEATRSLNMFQIGMIENVTKSAQNCSSCGGAK